MMTVLPDQATWRFPRLLAVSPHSLWRLGRCCCGAKRQEPAYSYTAETIFIFRRMAWLQWTWLRLPAGGYGCCIDRRGWACTCWNRMSIRPCSNSLPNPDSASGCCWSVPFCLCTFPGGCGSLTMRWGWDFELGKIAIGCWFWQRWNWCPYPWRWLCSLSGRY